MHAVAGVVNHLDAEGKVSVWCIVYKLHVVLFSFTIIQTPLHYAAEGSGQTVRVHIYKAL